MLWTSERVNWREEATGVGARKRSTAAIHAAEGGTGTRGDRRCQRRDGDIRVHGHRHGRARQCTRRRMRWQVHGHRHGRARQCTRRRMRWQVHGRVKVGGDLMEPHGIKLGDNVRLPAHQCHGDGRWRSRGDRSRNGSEDRRGVFPQGQFNLVPKRLMFLRLRLGVFLRKLED